jgi:DNA-binding transcriptional regulator GbsR (MarR family)
MAQVDKTEDAVARSELRVADVIGALMEFWGFKRPMGRLWTLLYLSPEPLPAAELGARLSMSSGAVSMTLGELVKWGAVRKTWRPGERRDYYEAESNIWKMITRVVRERELTLVRDAAESFAEAERTFSAAAADPERRAERARLELARARLGQLLTLAQVGEAFLSTVVAGEPADPTPIRQLGQTGQAGPMGQTGQVESPGQDLEPAPAPAPEPAQEPAQESEKPPGQG